MKDSGVEWIGKIPTEWSIGRVKHAFTRKNEKAMQDDPVVLSLARSGVRVRDVSNNEGQVAESYFNYNPVDIDDLLLNPMDLYSGANCSISKVVGVISPAYVNLKSKDGINPVFYDYYFKVQYWLMAFFAHGKGVSYENRWTLNTETLMNYPVVTLSYEEQCKRADYLNDKYTKIDAIIARQQEVIEKLKAYRLAVITETVTKGLNPDALLKDSGYKFIGSIPSTWEVLKLRYIGSCQNGISKGGEFFGTGFPFVSYSDVNKNIELPETVSGLIESTDNERKNFSVQKGDIFFTRTSETIEEIGFTSVCMKTIENSTFAGFLIRVRPYNNILYPAFSKYYFRSEKHRRFFVKEMNLVTRASLGQELLKRLPVLLPPMWEQKQISEYLDDKCAEIDNIISGRMVTIRKLIEYRKSLVYEVVTGKMEV
ncbi:MAG: restriction endonuclease subunit S [Eubacteriales bacterium]|nr:restriction endonuclease subunit S [Eubacteriales bacterium]